MSEIERYGDSFDDFADHPDSAFYVAEGLSPEETNREIVASMDRVLLGIIELQHAGQVIPLSTDALCDWHRGIFMSTFPEDAGTLRWKTGAGVWETVTFGVGVGTRMTRRILGRQGAPPRATRRRLDRIFRSYAQDLARASSDGITLRDAALSATHVYAKSLSVHAFVDGNLRASFVALQATLLNYGLPPVVFKDLEAHDDHLDRALRPGGRKQSNEPFAEYLAGLIRRLTGDYAGRVSTVKIIDFDTPDRVEHVVFGDELVPLTAEAVHALSLNAQLLASGETIRAARVPNEPTATA